MGRTARLALGLACVVVIALQANLAGGSLITKARRPVPIVLERSQLRAGCARDAGTTCAFWFNNGSAAIGDSNFGFANLDQWGVAADDGACVNAGATPRGEWIVSGYPHRLALADPPPTYVCVTTGHATSNWDDFVQALGTTRSYPVDACWKNVNAAGDVVLCGRTPDKYAIVGFRRFTETAVYKGNDPAAIGTPGTPAASGTCTNQSLGLDGGGARQLDALAEACSGRSSIDSIPFDAAASISDAAALSTTFKVYRLDNNVRTYYQGCLAGGSTAGCDYTYDPATFGLQWVDATTLSDGATKLIDLQWNVNGTPGTPGACGIRLPDPNAICLVLTAA